jgi:hypothetical protein
VASDSCEWLDDWLAQVPDAGYGEFTSRPVILLRCGAALRTLDAEQGGLAMFESDCPVEVFDPATKRFVALSEPLELSSDSTYAAAADLWAEYERVVRRPRLVDAARREMLERSRASGVLQPLAAYIVVENSAQWEAMRRKEEQSLSQNGALEFDEFDSPEPSLWIMLPGVALVVLLTRRRGGK